MITEGRMATASKGARRTAALRYIEEDLGLPSLISAQFNQTEELEKIIGQRTDAKLAYEEALNKHKKYVTEQSLIHADVFRASGEKITDAGMTRFINESLDRDKQQVKLADAVHKAKTDLIKSDADYEQIKNVFRVGRASLEAVTQQLNYLAASKAATVTATSELSGL